MVTLYAANTSRSFAQSTKSSIVDGQAAGNQKFQSDIAVESVVNQPSMS
jgi:hypothetical protein